MLFFYTYQGTNAELPLFKIHPDDSALSAFGAIIREIIFVRFAMDDLKWTGFVRILMISLRILTGFCDVEFL